MSAPRALIMAGGTGGHIFPALALAQALQARGWDVHWLGARGRNGQPSMEQRVAGAHGLPLHLLAFGGVRGKGMLALALLPLRLLRAMAQALGVLRRLRPAVVVGFGGYVTFPAGLMAVWLGRALILHEQNAVAGLANRVLAQVADRVYAAFPGALAQAQWVGNPLRRDFINQADPAARYGARTGPLRLLVVGGSLGAQALNTLVPQALARLTTLAGPDAALHVVHQTGGAHLDATRAAYAQAGVRADVRAFIDDMAPEMAAADVVLCRAGASTVTELAAVGVASVLVPYPHAVDDHQRANARYLADAGAAWLVDQTELNADQLTELLLNMKRSALMALALKAKNLQKIDATDRLVAACEEMRA